MDFDDFPDHLRQRLDSLGEQAPARAAVQEFLAMARLPIDDRFPRSEADDFVRAIAGTTDDSHQIQLLREVATYMDDEFAGIAYFNLILDFDRSTIDGPVEFSLDLDEEAPYPLSDVIPMMEAANDVHRLLTVPPRSWKTYVDGV
ncbi:hypothetical protein C8N24_6268 [Solirubrobacter pauli]|uniref:Uncharacterized protein n=1 Tax=Solirubrobacter pauli TaxID=166793 RepID=A0A660L2V5_9ACTN|nr:hypothetical protein [Solirubrobacter pauli]RKQ88226.1 hypothetical protein C8N24_6268 [Solirubrobacter pauli]